MRNVVRLFRPGLLALGISAPDDPAPKYQDLTDQKALVVLKPAESKEAICCWRRAGWPAAGGGRSARQARTGWSGAEKAALRYVVPEREYRRHHRPGTIRIAFQGPRAGRQVLGRCGGESRGAPRTPSPARSTSSSTTWPARDGPFTVAGPSASLSQAIKSRPPVYLNERRTISNADEACSGAADQCLLSGVRAGIGFLGYFAPEDS